VESKNPHREFLERTLRILEVPDCDCHFDDPVCCTESHPEGCLDRQQGTLKKLGWRYVDGVLASMPPDKQKGGGIVRWQCDRRGNWYAPTDRDRRNPMDLREAGVRLRLNWCRWIVDRKLIGGCDCAFPACRHVLGVPVPEGMEDDRKAMDYFDEWASLLYLHDPQSYREPDAAVYPTVRLPGEPGKIVVMRKRLKRGLSPFHPRDAKPTQALYDFEGIDVERDKRNGHVVRKGLRRQGGEGVDHAS
jgi:hypothetical protein